MRETKFIEQNKEKWMAFQKDLKRGTRDPEKLKNIFIQTTNDLSYARTFYPNRSVRFFLNGMAQRIYGLLYKTQKSNIQSFIHFWKEELPQLVYESRYAFRLSFFVFGLAILIGAFSTHKDTEFSRVILGDAYVDMTLENIRAGDPMAVYKDKNQMGMSLGITFNNIFVAFLAFLMGAFFMVGTFNILIQNGIMVGSFQYFFYQEGVFKESFLTIWTHGTLEISAIIIAGAAGITLGSGLIFPGTLSRLQAFQISAKRGLKIMISLVPIFIAAGFIEGMMTRYTETPDSIRLMFILICLFFIIAYYIVYPHLKARQGFANASNRKELTPNTKADWELYRIKTSGEIISNSVQYFRNRSTFFLSLFLKCTAIFALMGVAILWIMSITGEGRDESTSIFDSFSWVSNIFDFGDSQILIVVNTFIFSIVAYQVYRKIWSDFAAKDPFQKTPTQWTWAGMIALVGMVALNLYLLSADFYLNELVFFVVFPISLLSVYCFTIEGKGFFHAISQSLSFIFSNILKYGGLIFVLSFLTFMLLTILSGSFFGFLIDSVSINIPPDSNARLIINILLFLIHYFTLLGLFTLYLISFSIFYYASVEAKEAIYLKMRFKRIGKRRTIQGLEREA